MLLVFFESLVKSLELKSGNNTCFTNNLSSSDSSHFLGERKDLHETAYQERINQFRHFMC